MLIGGRTTQPSQRGIGLWVYHAGHAGRVHLECTDIRWFFSPCSTNNKLQYINSIQYDDNDLIQYAGSGRNSRVRVPLVSLVAGFPEHRGSSHVSREQTGRGASRWRWLECAVPSAARAWK